jgi:phosphopantothenoylcysteine decarboxylase/phosphopantothenate--cysteine ligase
LLLELVPTRDILASLPRERNFLVVGFAAETNDLENNARKKLHDKHLDLIVANDVSRSDIGMETAGNEVTILFQDGKTKKIARTSKKNIARELIKIISNPKKTV